MPVWEPHKLSTQMCKLFDSGRCTVDQFAKLIEEPVRLVERLTKNDGMKVHPELRLRCGKVLAAYHRKFPETKPLSEYEFEQRRKLKLVGAIEETIQREGTPRGVFEDRDCFPGLRAFTVIDSNGRCLMRVEMASAVATKAFEQRLVQWLNRIDPIGASITLS